MRDDWDDKYEKWKAEKLHRKPSTLVERVERSVEDVERELAHVEHEIETQMKSKKFNFVKLIVLLIPILIIGYLLYANFVVDQKFEYDYDIGSMGENYLTPVERVSASFVDGGVDYRNLTGQLVYFDVPVARGAEKVNVQIRMKDEFPANGKLSLGAKNAEEWSYLYKLIYNPGFDFTGLSKKGNVYRINENLPLRDETELLLADKIIVASDNLKPLVTSLSFFANKETKIEMTLRGKHVFYVYAKDYLQVKVKKKDINWYRGSDEFRVVLYDLDGKVIEFIEISDDGNTNVDKKISNEMTGTLQAAVKEGVYRLEMSDFDGLITEIDISTDKIVTDKVFLADNALYGVETKQSQLYFEYSQDRTLKLTTYHEQGLQKIIFNRNGNVQAYNFNKEDEPVYKDIAAGNYVVTFAKNDVVVESPEWIAFTPTGYFEPFRQRIIPVSSADLTGINVDYLISDYVAPATSHEGWKTVSAEFDIKNESLFVKDNKLSMVFNVPHLAKNSNYSIPIDWVKISVAKGGLV